MQHWCNKRVWKVTLTGKSKDCVLDFADRTSRDSNMQNVLHRKFISLLNETRSYLSHLHYASKHSYTGVFCLHCIGFLWPCPWVPMNESSRTMALRKKTLVVVSHLSVAFKYFPSWAHDCSSGLMHIYPSWNELISGCELCLRNSKSAIRMFSLQKITSLGQNTDVATGVELLILMFTILHLRM